MIQEVNLINHKPIKTTKRRKITKPSINKRAKVNDKNCKFKTAENSEAKPSKINPQITRLADKLGLSEHNLAKLELGKTYIGFTSGAKGKLLADFTRKLTAIPGSICKESTATHAILLQVTQSGELQVIDCGNEQGGLKKQGLEPWFLAPQTKNMSAFRLYDASSFIQQEKIDNSLEQGIEYDLGKLLVHGASSLIPIGTKKQVLDTVPQKVKGAMKQILPTNTVKDLQNTIHKTWRSELISKFSSDPKAQICSEFVANCFRSGILQQAGLQPEGINPARLEHLLAKNLGCVAIELK